jgi:hypothetical protein
MTSHRLPTLPGRAGGRLRRSERAALEQRVRRVLEHDASAVRPSDRLAEILTASRESPADRHAGSEERGDPRRSRVSRLAPLAAVAAAVLVATTAWVAHRPVDDAAGVLSPTRADSPRRPASPSVTATGRQEALSGSPTPVATGGVSTTASRTREVGLQSSLVPGALPVYRVGLLDSSGTRLGLVRELVPQATSSADGHTPAGRALAAARRSVDSTASGFDAGYRPLWDGAQVRSVSIDASGVVVTMSTGVPQLSQAEATLAVQQLVWTVQDAAGVGAGTRVRFVCADGSTRLAGPLAADTSYRRTSVSDMAAPLLAPVWIDSPARGQVVPAGGLVLVSGEATRGAALAWTLTRAGAPAASGRTTASASAPSRGAYSFHVGPLTPGFYAITVLDVTPGAGSDGAGWQMPFEVR